MGGFGQPPPTSFDNGLSTGKTFVFAKCINPNNCKWHLFQALSQIKHHQENWISKQVESRRVETRQVNDPCSIYPDCHSCIKAPQFCGWCSVPVMYNNTIPGKNCAGLNTTITPRFNCSGTFSTVDCSHATTSSTGTTSTGQTTGNPNPMFNCDPTNATCSQSPNGTLPKDVCTAQCTVNPIPPILQNKYFRGLEIDTTYRPGEWRAHFTTNTVTIVSASGMVIQGNVSTISDFLTIKTASGTYQTLWQLQPGPAVDNLSWAWSALNGPPPTSFDQAMTMPGQTEYWYVACHEGAPSSVCDFSH